MRLRLDTASTVLARASYRSTTVTFELCDEARLSFGVFRLLRASARMSFAVVYGPMTAMCVCCGDAVVLFEGLLLPVRLLMRVIGRAWVHMVVLALGDQ